MHRLTTEKEKAQFDFWFCEGFPPYFFFLECDSIRFWQQKIRGWLLARKGEGDRRLQNLGGFFFLDLTELYFLFTGRPQCDERFSCSCSLSLSLCVCVWVCVCFVYLYGKIGSRKEGNNFSDDERTDPGISPRTYISQSVLWPAESNKAD